MDETKLHASVDLGVVLRVELGMQLFDVYDCLVELHIVYLFEFTGSLLYGPLVESLPLLPKLLVA